MDKLLIRGGRRLNGTVTISGAKNAALPMAGSQMVSVRISSAVLPTSSSLSAYLTRHRVRTCGV